MEIYWKWLNLCLGLLFFQLCNGFPINLEDSVADQHTQLLTGLVAVLLTICSVVLLAGCLCCQRRNGFKEFRDSPVVASAASNLDHGHVNPIANGEFTIFTPLSSSPYNNNVFLANERIITRTAEDFVYEDFDVTSWFNESEKDFPRIKLKYIKELGEGWFGKVVEGAAKEVPPNEEAWTPVVVRILDATASRKERVLFLNDAAIYRCGAHTHILSLIGRCLDTVPLLLLQEYCSQGDLKKYLKSKKGNPEQLLSTDYPLLWCCQLTSALKHLHNNGITHPDLATRNCQLTSDLTLKVGDYGLAESNYPEDYYQGSPRVPVRWCSPESLTCTLTTIQPKKPTSESNIWSLGVTIWEICECGAQPYSMFSDDEVVSQVLSPPNVKLSRPSFPVLYTDYLYRLMQLCWTNAESRPTVSQIDLMLSDLWQVYKNTKNSDLSADDFDKRWASFKPNSIVKNDVISENAEMEEAGATITKPLSPSLNNLHGSLDNLLDSGDQMELWLENVTKSDDLSLAKTISNPVLSLDDPLVSEISSSDSSDRTSPKQKKLKQRSKLDFDLNTKFRDSIFKPYNFSDSALFSQRTSSESETEDENWRKKVERGAYTEKVRLKSRSVADLMILTHVDYSESESETPVPSLDYRVNYKNVRYAPKNNLENVSLTYGSEGNLLSVHDTFQEELKKLKEERRDSLLFVPDNYSHSSFNKLDNNNHNFPLEELTLSDSNLNNINMIDSTNGKRLMQELNRVAEIQPANQVFNVFSVTIDKFKPIHVNSCKLNDIINFKDVDPCFTSEKKEGQELLFKELEKQPVEESLSPTNDNQNDKDSIDSCDINEEHISDLTYPAAHESNLQEDSDDVYTHELSNGKIHNWEDTLQSNNEDGSEYQGVKADDSTICTDETGIEPDHPENVMEAKSEKPFIQTAKTQYIVDTINPIFINAEITNGLETELSSSVITPISSTVSPVHTDVANDVLDSNLQITASDLVGYSDSDREQNIVKAINSKFCDDLILPRIGTKSDTDKTVKIENVTREVFINEPKLADENVSLNENVDSQILNLNDDLVEIKQVTVNKSEENCEVSDLKLCEIDRDENVVNIESCESITEVSSVDDKFQVPRLADIKDNLIINNNPEDENLCVEFCKPNELPENVNITKEPVIESLLILPESNTCSRNSSKNISKLDQIHLANLNENSVPEEDNNFQQLKSYENASDVNATEIICTNENTGLIHEIENRMEVPKLSDIAENKIKECEKFLYEERIYNQSKESDITDVTTGNGALPTSKPIQNSTVKDKVDISFANSINSTKNIICEQFQNSQSKDAIDLAAINFIGVDEIRQAGSSCEIIQENKQSIVYDDAASSSELLILSERVEADQNYSSQLKSQAKIDNLSDSNLGVTSKCSESEIIDVKENRNVIKISVDITEKLNFETSSDVDINEIILVDTKQLENDLQIENKTVDNIIDLNGVYDVVCDEHSTDQNSSELNSQPKTNNLLDSNIAASYKWPESEITEIKENGNITETKITITEKLNSKAHEKCDTSNSVDISEIILVDKELENSLQIKNKNVDIDNITNLNGVYHDVCDEHSTDQNNSSQLNSQAKTNNLLDSNVAASSKWPESDITEIKENGNITETKISITEKLNSKAHEKCETSNDVDISEIILVDKELENDLQIKNKNVDIDSIINLNGVYDDVCDERSADQNNSSQLNPQAKIDSLLDSNVAASSKSPENEVTEIKENGDITETKIGMTEKLNSEAHEKCENSNDVDINEIILVDEKELEDDLQIKHENVDNDNILDLNGVYDNNSQKTPIYSSQDTFSETGSSSNPEEKYKIQANDVDLDDIILDMNEFSNRIDNFKVPTLSQIVQNKNLVCENKFSDADDTNDLINETLISDADCKFVIPKLSQIIQNKYVISKHHNDKYTVQSESHPLCDKKGLAFEDAEHTECNKNDNIEIETKATPPTPSRYREEISPNVADISVFTSTPAANRQAKYIPSKDTYTHLDLFGSAVDKEDAKNRDFYADLVPLDTSKEMNYSLETWDNFLGKSLDAQNDTRHENLFDSFSSEPHSLLFVENGNLIQPQEGEKTFIKDSNQVKSNIDNISNVNNETFVIDAHNEKTFVKDENSPNNGTFTLNKTESIESETEDTADSNSAWGAGGGWFLHPQTSNKEPSGTIEVRENTGSYVGFGIDDEIMAAIRNELLNKLPHAQVAPSEKVTEIEEWDSSDKNEVFLKYNIYNPPLSPILEESYLEESDVITPKREDESDNEDSEWSEPDMPETLPQEPESQSGHTYDSQLKPHHRHTPSQDSCCSNDTLFNLEELTCVTGDVEKEIDHLKNVSIELPLVEDPIDSESEQNEKFEDTLKEESVEKDKVVLDTQDSSPDDLSGIVRSETNNNTNGKNLNRTVVIDNADFDVEELEETEQKDNLEDNHNEVNLHLGDDQEINLSEPTNSEGTNYIAEFISQEIDHSSRQFSKHSEGSSSEPNSSLDESPIAFKKIQVAPLPSPEDNPWKQLPASLLSYDKVISQNNSLLLPTEESNDIVPEFNDLPADKKDENTKESQCENLEEFNEECEGSNDPHYENCNVTNNQPVYENVSNEASDNKTKEPLYENTKDDQPVYENIKEAQPVYQNINHPNDIYNEVDYVNIVNLENSKNNVEYAIDKKEYISTESDQSENKINSETSQEEDIYGMLTDIKFNGPTENQLISTSFSESNDINDEQDWDSGSDTRSSSSGEFIWKEGEHEESLKALRAAPQDVLEDIKPMEGITEESTDESDVSSNTSDEEGEVPEFVPSAWDKFATPTKSALRSPEKTLEKSEKNKSKGVWFKKQKYHCVYEYPREPESPILQSQDLWKPQLDCSPFIDWEFDADTYFPTTADDNDIFPSAYNYQPKNTSSRNLYQLTSISDFVPSNSGLEDEFFVSSSARPFDAVGSLSSQFFPGSTNWTGDNATPDSGMEDSTPGSSTEISECNTKSSKTISVPSLKNLASEAAKRSKQMSVKNNDAIGGLRHTRNKLKLDLPPSPSAFTSTKMFMVEPTLEPVIREKPTFTTFGKSRFSVQHVDTPPEESKNKNVSFEALPYKPIQEDVGKLDQKELCDDINEQNEFVCEKQILHDKFDRSKTHSEFIRGEASLLDSADEDSGIESSTLERKLSNDGLLQ